MDRAGWNYPSGELRASDADRDQALAELGEAFRAGRLTAEEFDQRSGQALAARTGKELAVLLADLPAGDVRTVRAAALAEARRIVVTRAAIGVSAVAAFAFGLSALAAALAQGPSLQQREFAREMLERQGIRVPPGFPPDPGFNWAGTVGPAVIAVLLVALIVCLRVRLTRANRRYQGNG
jgi:hypothetical protein